MKRFLKPMVPWISTNEAVNDTTYLRMKSNNGEDETKYHCHDDKENIEAAIMTRGVEPEEKQS